MTTWIVVADGRHARILREAVRGAPLEPAMNEDLVNPAAKGFSRELGEDKPGRAFDPGSGTPHAMEPREDPHKREERRFAEQVARTIEAAAQGRQFERLVLIAPPRMLGDLRTALSDATRRLVVAEDHKELLNLPAAEFTRHVRGVLDHSR